MSGNQPVDLDKIMTEKTPFRTFNLGYRLSHWMNEWPPETSLASAGATIQALADPCDISEADRVNAIENVKLDGFDGALTFLAWTTAKKSSGPLLSVLLDHGLSPLKQFKHMRGLSLSDGWHESEFSRLPPALWECLAHNHVDAIRHALKTLDPTIPLCVPAKNGKQSAPRNGLLLSCPTDVGFGVPWLAWALMAHAWDVADALWADQRVRTDKPGLDVALLCMAGSAMSGREMFHVQRTGENQAPQWFDQLEKSGANPHAVFTLSNGQEHSATTIMALQCFGPTWFDWYVHPSREAVHHSTQERGRRWLRQPEIEPVESAFVSSVIRGLSFQLSSPAADFKSPLSLEACQILGVRLRNFSVSQWVVPESATQFTGAPPAPTTPAIWDCMWSCYGKLRSLPTIGQSHSETSLAQLIDTWSKLILQGWEGRQEQVPWNCMMRAAKVMASHNGFILTSPTPPSSDPLFAGFMSAQSPSGRKAFERWEHDWMKMIATEKLLHLSPSDPNMVERTRCREVRALHLGVLDLLRPHEVASRAHPRI